MFNTLVVVFLPVLNGSYNGFGFIDAFFEFSVLDFDESLLFGLMGISVPETSFEGVISCVGMVFVDGGLFFGEDSFEHGLIGGLDIKLS